MRKYVIKFIMVVMLLVNVVGAINVLAAEEQPKKISGNIEVISNISEESMERYIEAFCKKYPEVEITYQYYSDYENEVKKRMESGDYGDVLFMPGFVSESDYAKYFMLLGSYDELEEKYNYLETSKRIDQDIYGIPSSAYITGILYNKDVFYQAGISEPPKSIDEFMQALEYIKERTDAIPFYTNYAESWPLQSWEYFPYIEMTGDPDYKENSFIKQKKSLFRRFDALSGL